MVSESEAASEKLKSVTRDGPGRPPIEDSFPQLHETVVKIASFLAGADGQRRTDILEACHTLGDLHAALLKEGYNLSRSTLYYRLVPHKSNNTEGKKHVRTVPVKIRRAKNNIHARHQDANFTFSIKHYLKQVASFFGRTNAFVLSVDDKAKVPIGVTAAKYQSPLVMHMTYEIQLPDHDFVKAWKHKLTPSVYAACEIKSASAKSQEEITYSGPTYIAIRSYKHDSSTAYSHGYDFNHVVAVGINCHATHLDNFCPSVQKDLEKRQCKGCRIYFASAAAVDRHVKGKGCKSSLLIPVTNPAISMEVEECGEEEFGNDNDALPVISIGDILNASPFIELLTRQDDVRMKTKTSVHYCCFLLFLVSGLFE